MIFSKTRIYKYKNTFILLAASFTAMLIMFSLILSVQDKMRHAQWVQEQCEFRNAFEMSWESCEDDTLQNNVTGEELFRSIPELSAGMLVIEVFFDASDLTKYSQLQYVLGDYSQAAYPLQSGGNISLENGENAFYIGESYLPYLIESEEGEFLNLGGVNLEVTGVMDDITGKGRDERLILFGKDVPEDLLLKIQQSLENNQVRICYFSNKPEGEKEADKVLSWINQNRLYHFSISPYDQNPAYEYHTSLPMTFFKWAFYPILICCICNCLIIINVYVKKMRQNIFIRRMCGMTYMQLVVMIGSDYGLLLLPAVVVTGAVSGQFAGLFIIGMLMAVVFALFSMVLIRREFRREGRCM